MPKAVPWRHFAAVRPDLAAAGRRLLVSPDPPRGSCLEVLGNAGDSGSNPVSVVVADGELWCLLCRNHAACLPRSEVVRVRLHDTSEQDAIEAIELRGSLEEIIFADTRERVLAEAGLWPAEPGFLFRFRIESALLTRWETRDGKRAWPRFYKWRAR